MATEYGAKVLGWNDTGKLVKGNKADLIIMEDKFKTPVTIDNIFDQIVVHGQKEFIHSVYINGKAVLEDRNLRGINKDKISGEMRDVAEEFWKF
jgi:cytosine/adenosine deaminase-related metal-dependent hydrolase